MKLDDLPVELFMDSSISLMSKSIYLLFASAASEDRRAQISREYILSGLNISKQSYYTYLQILLDKGYVIREPQPNHGQSFRIGVFRIAYPVGLRFGIVDKSIVFASVSANAKGLYAYLCANLVSPWKTELTAGKIMTDLKMKRFQFDRLTNELADEGYIISVRKAYNKSEEKVSIRFPD